LVAFALLFTVLLAMWAHKIMGGVVSYVILNQNIPDRLSAKTIEQALVTILLGEKRCNARKTEISDSRPIKIEIK